MAAHEMGDMRHQVLKDDCVLFFHALLQDAVQETLGIHIFCHKVQMRRNVPDISKDRAPSAN